MLTLKNYGSRTEQAKPGYVAQGYIERNQPYIIHDIATHRAPSIRLIFTTSFVLGFFIFNQDVIQAYV